MSKPTPEEQKQQELNLELRKAFNDAYAFVEGQKTVQSFSAITFEELLDQQIERISGKDTPTRPNVLNRIAQVLSTLEQAIEKVNSLPPEAFAPKDPQKDANTDPE